MKEKQHNSEVNHTVEQNDINVMGEDINKPQRSNKRREMEGPKDIDNLLSNLKTVKKSSKKDKNVITFE